MNSSDGARGYGILAVSLLPFVLLATLNSAGYRYGASDQAFYAPAILEAHRSRALSARLGTDPIAGQADARRRRARSAGARDPHAPAGGVRRAAGGLAVAARVRRAADRRPPVSDRLGGRRADGGAHAAPRGQQVGHEHTRRVLPPAAAGLRDRRARDRELPSRPLRCHVGARRCRGRAPSDDGPLVRDLARRRYRAGRAAPAAAHSYRRRGGRGGRRVGPLRRTARGTAGSDGPRLARDARVEGLSLSAELAGGRVAGQSWIRADHPLDLSAPARRRAARASRGRTRGRMPVAGAGLCRDARAECRARRPRHPVAARADLLDARLPRRHLRRLGRRGRRERCKPPV